jgi:hypothetical protein
MQTAHVWLLEHFEGLAHGAVIDVEHILGERRRGGGTAC